MGIYPGVRADGNNTNGPKGSQNTTILLMPGFPHVLPARVFVGTMSEVQSRVLSLQAL